MAKITLDLNQFKASGVYTIEFDSSERVVLTTETIRLVVGFSRKGPFNAPVFLRDLKTARKIFGEVDTYLEKKGSFFHRSIETCLQTGPVFALNLLALEKEDKVEYNSFSLVANKGNFTGFKDETDNFIKFNEPLYSFFNKERFWKTDSDYLDNIATKTAISNDDETPKTPFISFVNISQKPMSYIIRKAKVNGYALSAREWYGAGNVPGFIYDEQDFIEDYFIEVIAIEGDWTNYTQLKSDPIYSSYFDVNGIKVDRLNDFMRLDEISVIGNFVGTVIPDFLDKNGSNQFIEVIINNTVGATGILCSVNRDLLDDYSESKIDMVGHTLIGEGDGIKFLSYDINKDDITNDDITKAGIRKEVVVEVDEGVTDINNFTYEPGEDNDNYNIEVGDFIVHDDKTLVKVIKKEKKKKENSEDKDKFIITTASNITITVPEGEDGDDNPKVTVFKPINKAATELKLYSLGGFKLTDEHLPGNDIKLETILSVIEETNIGVALASRDIIQFRYIIDTFDGGLGLMMGPKAILSRLAKNRQKCMAILNAPSIKRFVDSTDPQFTEKSDDNPTALLKAEYIASGGNLDLGPSELFTLPDEENGSKFIGVFSPFLSYRENNKTIQVPPAADVSNNFIRKFLNGQPYSIVAGPRRGVISNPKMVGLEYEYTLQDREFLEPAGINPIVNVRNVGTMIYGNQSAYQRTSSAFNNLHVRDLLINVEAAIEDVLAKYLFEFNDASTRLEIKSIVENYLERVRNAGGVYDYIVIMDETNNTEETIDANFGILDVGLEPARGMQKFVNRVTILKTGAIASGGFTIS